MMNRLRKPIWLLLALCLLLSGTVFVHAYDISFSDVTEVDWYYGDVMALAESGVISGYPDGTYRPSKNVTTGEALKMILLAAGYPEPEAAASHWARGYLNFAIAQGFLVRYEDISDLDINMTRGMTAKLAANALGLEIGQSWGLFTDTDSAYAEALYNAGIVSGYPDGTFRPTASISRAEIAAIVNRIYQSREPSAPVDTDIDASSIELRASEELIAFLKKKEGFREKAYWDYSQYSIGYGSACTKDEYPDGITEAQADVLLRQMVKTFEEKLDSFLLENNITLPDNQYDALVSLTYNIGSGWMKDSALATLLKSGSYTHNELASAIGIWCHVTSSGVTSVHEGLVARRIEEINLFLYGDYSGNSTGFYWVQFEQSEKGDRARDIAFYEAGSRYDPAFDATSTTGEVFLGWYTESGALLTDLTATENRTVTARWASDEMSVSGTEGYDPWSWAQEPTQSEPGEGTYNDPFSGDTW